MDIGLQGRHFTLKTSLLYGYKMRLDYSQEQHQKQAEIRLNARCLKRFFYKMFKVNAEQKSVAPAWGKGLFGMLKCKFCAQFGWMPRELPNFCQNAHFLNIL
jgi:hypothetical protein